MYPWEEERSWRDPSAHRLCGAAVTWLNRHQQRKIVISVRPVADARLLTIVHRSKNCLIGSILSHSKRRSSSLSVNALTYFLTLASPDAPSRLQKFKLRAWLNLFSRFSNPMALHATDTLREIYRSLISYPDRELQVASLSYLLAYESPHFRHHEESCVYSSTKPNGEMS
ncbi:hypothetical protein M405DRAFT_832474 [Rhizopogon salebrosus TDB-379]|nr:hypothetical protein M405DRAFT_832474 [Rhizopogon salebrosus TDB-379]